MLKLANAFQKGMVLQRGKEICIWGSGNIGQKVEIFIQERHAETEVNEDGFWKTYIPALIQSNNETLTVKSGNEELVVKDVAIGEVWIAAGQSNMEFWMRYEKHYQEERIHCENPDIRFFDVPKISFDGQEDCFDYSRVGHWRKASEKDLEYFSAVGYYFAKELSKAKGVSVGIIGCNWGGTASMTWMSETSLKKAGLPWLKDYEEQIKGMDMEDYWKRQATNQINDTGNPFSNIFNECALPKTVTWEEWQKVLGNLSGDFNLNFTDIIPHTIPCCLYEHMVKRIAPYTVKGVLWYQGESDDVDGRQVLYQDMLNAVIADWRACWNDSELPFLIVQLPGWERWLDQENHDYKTIRKSQENVTKETAQTYLCSISDAGEQADIHPKNKKIVGERLALLARGTVYNEDILCNAPTFEKLETKGQKITLSFRNTGEGLYVKGDKINALEVFICEESVDFQYEISGSNIILTLEQKITGNIRIEFAQQKWFKVNLYNEAGIPAIPFVKTIEL